jgi:adenylylsulfate kinase
MVYWLTGLSGSGKSTIAQEFVKKNKDFVLLDGDSLRTGLNSDLGFSDEDRKENLRRLREVCKLFVKNGKNVITAFISPFEEDRLLAKKEIPDCKIIYVKCSLDTCEIRDVKGLYKKARNGEIKQFTGIDSPFEEPKNPDLIIPTDELALKQSIKLLNNLYNGETWLNALTNFCK